MDKVVVLKNGFSMVELLVAIVIIGMTVLTITTFLKNSLLMNSDSKGSEVAYLTGQEKLVELESMVNPSDSSDTVTIDGMKYIRVWSITRASGNNLLSTASITVQYQASGKPRSVTFTGGLN